MIKFLPSRESQCESKKRRIIAVRKSQDQGDGQVRDIEDITVAMGISLSCADGMFLFFYLSCFCLGRTATVTCLCDFRLHVVPNLTVAGFKEMGCGHVILRHFLPPLLFSLLPWIACFLSAYALCMLTRALRAKCL